MLPLPSLALLHHILVKMEEEATNKRNEVDILTDEVLVLILRHLTARTVSRPLVTVSTAVITILHSAEVVHFHFES